eukprot:XP_017445969.1 PREDICTED: membrane-spanning 4-domains subfamily A member 18 [Rattus norvegicus]
MSNQENVSAVTVTVPGNVRAIQPTYAVVSGGQEQPLQKATMHPASATVLQCNPGSANFQNPHVVIQNPAGMTGLQARPTGLQYPAGMASVQTAPGVIQYSPEMTSVQILPGDPQNPLNTVPGPTQTSSHPQWNMSFMSFPEFNPKKFINEEVRTLGAIQILIGLFHVFSAFNPHIYWNFSVLGASGYLIWGGLSFIISGSLSVLAEKDTNSCVVNSSIGMNVISSIFSLTGILVIIIDLCFPTPGISFLMVSITTDWSQCFFRARRALHGGFLSKKELQQNSSTLKTEMPPFPLCSMKVTSGILLPFALLEFILTCVVSHFGCQAVCWPHFENMTVFPTMFGGNTVNTTTGPVSTTSPNSATNIPVQPTLPSDVPPEQLYHDVADHAQK